MYSELCSISEAIESLALSLEGVHHVCGHDGLPLGVLGVGHGIPHHVLQEHPQHRPDLKIRKCFQKTHSHHSGEIIKTTTIKAMTLGLHLSRRTNGSENKLFQIL